jgi:hypothetical protein
MAQRLRKGQAVCFIEWVYPVANRLTTSRSMEISTGIITRLRTYHVSVAIDFGDKEREIRKEEAFPLKPQAVAYLKARIEQQMLADRINREASEASQMVHRRWKPDLDTAKEQMQAAFNAIPVEDRTF